MQIPEVFELIAHSLSSTCDFFTFLRAVPRLNLSKQFQSILHLASNVPERLIYPRFGVADVTIIEMNLEAVKWLLIWNPHIHISQIHHTLLNHLPLFLQSLTNPISYCALHLELHCVTITQLHHLTTQHGSQIQSLSIKIHEPRNIPLGKSSFERLRHAIAACGKLSLFHLQLDHPAWNGAHLQYIFDYLVESSIVNFKLCISGYRGDSMTNRCSFSLVEWLICVPVISFAWIDPDPTETQTTPAILRVVHALSASKTIKKIDLSLSKALMTTFATLRNKASPKSMQTLIAEYPYAPESYILSLGQRIIFSSITQLDLTWNPSSSIIALVPYLPRLSCLESLNLSHCYLMIDGSRALAQILPRIPSLTQLYLTSNDLFDTGATTISLGVAGCKKLKYLYLNKNQLTDSSLARLVLGCRACPTLQHVDISDNLYKNATVRRIHKKADLISKICTVVSSFSVDYEPRQSMVVSTATVAV
ncbi:hypothetical protein THRCLA_20139 [Thraustotheca clavata]|uniref:Uncharacterized protein n=1 Tax=Thraustotheca clavata TaxID=74557 RepID=A0A1W0ABF3_9STRA|nr:hypothetical protein THRCLA_20139 [Thraustotheca clavata]